MPRRNLQIPADQHGFSSLEDVYAAYARLVTTINESFYHLEELESFVRSEEGQTHTYGGNMDMSGFRIRGLPRTRFADEPVSRAEMRDLGIFADTTRQVRATKKIVAEQGIDVPITRTSGNAVSLSQMTEYTQSVFANAVDLTNTQTITGVKDFSNGLQIGTNETISAYDEATFTLTGGGFSTPPTATARYVLLGNLVVLFLPDLSGTSNATSFTVTGMPAAIQTARTTRQPVAVTDNSAAVSQPGLISMTTGGTWTLFTSYSGAGWTASGTKAIRACTITYNLL